MCSFTALGCASCCGNRGTSSIWAEPYIVACGQVAWWTPRKIPFVFWTAQNISKSYAPPFSMIEKYCVERCAGWMGSGQLVIHAMLTRPGYDRKHIA